MEKEHTQVAPKLAKLPPAVGLVTIYDPNGQPVLVEPVDAREMVEHNGYTRTPPEAPQPREPKAPDNPKGTKGAKSQDDSKDPA